MVQWWDALSSLQKVYACIALPATLVLIIQTLLVLFGGDGDFGADGIDIDDMSDGLTLFSVRGIAAFCAVGGWVGLLIGDSALAPVLSVLISLAAGTASLFGIALIFKAANKLQSSGNLDMKNAVGKTAKVYITVFNDKKGIGKITMTLQGRFVECDAVTYSGRDLHPGELVEVIGLADENTLIVSPVAANAVK